MNVSRPSKRLLVIAIVSMLLVAGTGVYTWQSISAWKAYETRLKNEQKELTRLKDDSLDGGGDSERLVAIRALDDKIAKRSELCTMNGAYAWQATVIPVLKNVVNECKTKVAQLDVIAGPLSALRQYLDVGEKVRSVVATLAPGEILTDKNWTDKGLKRTEHVKRELSGLSVNGDGAGLKSEAIKYADNLVTAWKSLVKANDAKDKTGFLTASAAVAAAYADFSGLADSSDEVIQQKVTELTTAAKGL